MRRRTRNEEEVAITENPEKKTDETKSNWNQYTDRDVSWCCDLGYCSWDQHIERDVSWCCNHRQISFQETNLQEKKTICVSESFNIPDSEAVSKAMAASARKNIRCAGCINKHAICALESFNIPDSEGALKSMAVSSAWKNN